MSSDKVQTKKERRDEAIVKLKKGMKQFNKELMLKFPNESELKLGHALLKTNMIPVKYFVKLWVNTGQIHTDRILIKNRDDTFFKENPFFKDYPSIKQAFIENIWNSGQLCDEEKEIIWKWQELFLSLGEEYANNMEK